MNCPYCRKEIDVRLVGKMGPAPSSPPADIEEATTLFQSIDPITLNDFESNFYQQFKERLEKYKDRTMVSEKQLGILKKMANKGF